MKVKKGMASRFSVDITPKTRSGSAWRKVGGKRSSQMPRRPKREADEGEREGDRVADEQNDTSAANMIGAMLWMRKAVIASPRSGYSTGRRWRERRRADRG